MKIDRKSAILGLILGILTGSIVVSATTYTNVKTVVVIPESSSLLITGDGVGTDGVGGYFTRTITLDRESKTYGFDIRNTGSKPIELSWSTIKPLQLDVLIHIHRGPDDYQEIPWRHRERIKLDLGETVKVSILVSRYDIPPGSYELTITIATH